MTPAHLRGRKNALRDAFEALSEMEAWIFVHGSPHELLAARILAEARIAVPRGQTAVQTLAACRLRAHDEPSLAKLETAYRAVLGVTPGAPPDPAPDLPAAPPMATPAPPANRPGKTVRKARAGRK